MKFDKNKKYIGSCCGNSFVILDCRDNDVDRQSKIIFAMENIVRYSVDSALFLCKSKDMDVFMKIFEKDGSESDSCGNGTILIAYLLGFKEGRIEMKDNAAISLGDAEKQSILMNIKFSRIEELDEEGCLFVRMGEPHVIRLVDDLDKFDLVDFGRRIQKKYPSGVNVDVIQKLNEFSYRIKTYERGVFSETDSCGTGSLASYLAISHFSGKIYKEPVEFKSVGGSHWVSRNENMLKLEVFKKFCKIELL
ncbi:MAG: hypothetical protein WCO05_01400 [Candidatus Moraniibacteriota bacterium]|jgi:diaminopimelate epimerase